MNPPPSDIIEPDKLCICDCNTGRFIVNITMHEIEYIYAIVVNASAASGDYITDPLAKKALEDLSLIMDYLATRPDRNE